MKEDSARANVVSALALTGIIDESGKPTDCASRWRDDSDYKTVCEEIRKEVYPQELLDLAPDVSANKATIERWLAQKYKLGEAASSKQAAFYLLLLEADATKEKENEAKPAKSVPNSVRANGKTERSRKGEITSTATESESAVVTTEHSISNVGKRTSHPSLHIDIQIHISPEASADQIDKIFESMAKHFKDI